jgi:1-acyl-sn-glycerol-3-phosphate acyltransferase
MNRRLARSPVREPAGVFPPPVVNSPSWKVPFNKVRSALVLLMVLAVSAFLDVWQRLGLLPGPWSRKERVIARVNSLMHFWGVVVFWINRVGMGLRVKIEGKAPASGRHFIVSNHQSSLDIPLLITLFRGQNLKFVAMEELRYCKPGVSMALRTGGFVFLAKQSREEDLAALEVFARQLDRYDGSPLIFPEGRRTDDGYLLPFHFAGTETVRRNARLPFVMVTIDGLWEARTIHELHKIVGSRVTVRISEPIPFKETERDPRAACRLLEETIRRNMEEIRRSSAAGSG